MCARPKHKRKIVAPVHFTGFKPMGYYGHEKMPIILNIEEYESIRLSDYELLSQEEASKFMHISRPTFTRIYENARRKIASAFAEIRSITIEGGDYFFENHWYYCNECEAYFNKPHKSELIAYCTLCGSDKIEETNI